MTASLRDSVAAAIPTLRGTLIGDAELADATWFRTGGPADLLFVPADEDDLALFLAALDQTIPVLVIGLGSNLLVRDGGIAGVVIRLGRAFAGIQVSGTTIIAGAAAPDVKLASSAAQAGVGGLSFLRGIPGSVGGALRMNGGAYGSDVATVLVGATGIDRSGATHEFTPAAMGFTYRHCDVPDDVIFTRAVFAGAAADPDTIRADMAAITQARAASQPVNQRTGGSTFKNPPGAKAWALIDQAGCRGLEHGAAQVSPLHTNFLINRGGASAADLEDLGEIVRTRVHQHTGIMLEWEIARIGQRERGRHSS